MKLRAFGRANDHIFVSDAYWKADQMHNNSPVIPIGYKIMKKVYLEQQEIVIIRNTKRDKTT